MFEFKCFAVFKNCVKMFTVIPEEGQSVEVTHNELKDRYKEPEYFITYEEHGSRMSINPNMAVQLERRDREAKQNDSFR